MKRNKYIIILFSIIALFSTSSCNDWLNVNPSGTITENALLDDGEGYRVLLNGIYKEATSSSLYGRELTWGLMSAMSLDYGMDDGWNDLGMDENCNYGKACFSYDYEDEAVKSFFENIWEQAYFVIANCNELIGNIRTEPTSKFVLGKLEQDLILGEALAMRALMHYEILKLYAPAPITGDNGKYIPYFIKEELSTVGEYHTTQEILDLIIDDLKEAEGLIKPFDTLCEARIELLNGTHRFKHLAGAKVEELDGHEDVFFWYRGYRLNYITVRGLLASVYNYKGGESLKIAAEIADSVINISFEEYPNPIWSFEKTSSAGWWDPGTYNIRRPNDLMFAVSEPQILEKYRPFSEYMGSRYGLDVYLGLTAELTDLVNEGGKDNRAKIFEKIKSSNLLRSKMYVTSTSSEDSYIIPILRYSEMYFIVAEYQASIGDYTAASQMLDKIRIARGNVQGYFDGVIVDQSTFVDEMIKEVRRETFAEGKAFYYYKKFNKLISSTMEPEDFVFEKPLSETSFGN